MELSRRRPKNSGSLDMGMIDRPKKVQMKKCRLACWKGVGADELAALDR